MHFLEEHWILKFKLSRKACLSGSWLNVICELRYLFLLSVGRLRAGIIYDKIKCDIATLRLNTAALTESCTFKFPMFSGRPGDNKLNNFIRRICMKLIYSLRTHYSINIQWGPGLLQKPYCDLDIGWPRIRDSFEEISILINFPYWNKFNWLDKDHNRHVFSWVGNSAIDAHLFILLTNTILSMSGFKIILIQIVFSFILWEGQ